MYNLILTDAKLSIISRKDGESWHLYVKVQKGPDAFSLTLVYPDDAQLRTSRYEGVVELALLSVLDGELRSDIVRYQNTGVGGGGVPE